MINGLVLEVFLIIIIESDILPLNAAFSWYLLLFSPEHVFS